MFSTLEQFRSLWEEEVENTIALMKHLTDASLSTTTDANHRTLGRLANHLVESVAEMPATMGLPIAMQHPAHTSVEALIADYQKVSAEFIKALNENYTDATLSEMRNMYGQQWTVSYALQLLILHQTHHRGQITVLMRQAGLTVPGMYGPSSDQWVAMGREPLV